MKSILFALVLAPYLALAEQALQITNSSGQPISGAEVMIGAGVNDPFYGNVFKTDSNGTLNIPSGWKTALPVTISADSYITTTFYNVEPKSGNFQLHLADTRTWHEIKGITNGFENIKTDGKVDFGFVFPAWTRRELVQFDLMNLISAETDRIKVLTEEVDIPSNLTLPEQKESYVLPVKLDKPQYRMYVKHPGNYRMTALHGQFPLKQVINELREGKSVFDVLYLFKFMNCGQRDVQVNGTIANQDIAVNQIRFDNSISVTAPTLSEDQVVVSVVLNDQNGVYFPTDLKRVKSTQTEKLVTPTSNSNRFALSMLMKAKKKDPKLSSLNVSADNLQLAPIEFFKFVTRTLYGSNNEDDLRIDESSSALSIAVQETAGIAKPAFLELIEKPKVVGNQIQLVKPSEINGVYPVATYLIFSEIEKPAEGQYGADKRYRKWEVYSSGWADVIDLPNKAIKTEPGKTYRWEVLYLGRSSDLNSPGGYFLDSVTHVTRNSIDL